MTLRNYLRDLVTEAADPSTDGTWVLHECRHCGVAVEPEDDTCPVCQSSEIARYVLRK